MTNDQENDQTENPAKQPADAPQENVSSDGEFKVTVRKLEMPVRPRGVLAE